MPALTGVAGLLAVGLAIAHSVLGERYILGRLLRRADLPHLLGDDWFTRRVLRFAWHLTSVAWCGLAAALILAGAGPAGRGVRQAVAITFLLSAVITAGFSRGRHLAWVGFLVIALLSWMA